MKDTTKRTLTSAGSPTTDGRNLYVSFGSFGTYCYDLDGKLLWKPRDLGLMNTRLGWGEAVTPVIHGDSLLLNCDQEDGSFVICLDPQTGETKWKADRDEKGTLLEHASGRRLQRWSQPGHLERHGSDCGATTWVQVNWAVGMRKSMTVQRNPVSGRARMASRVLHERLIKDRPLAPSR